MQLLKRDEADEVKSVIASTGVMPMKNLPGPKGIPILGNLHELKPQKLHRIIQKWSDEYGPVFQLKFGKIPIVVVTGAETIQYILKNRPEAFRRMHKMDEVIREIGVVGVFNAEGDDWKRQRKLFSQALNLAHVKQFFPLLAAITEKLFKHWNELTAQNSPIEIRAQLMRYTVDVTSRLAFGYNMNTIEKQDDAIQNHLEVIFPAIFKRINSPIPYWKYVKLPADKKLEKSMDAVRQIIEAIIDKARAQMNENGSLMNQPTNFLEALIAAGEEDNPVSNQEIIGNVITMLLAGEDTTAHTLTWIFYFMHLHPEVQQKMRQEADQVLQNDSVLSNYESTNGLKYIEAVAFEAMRLKPVAPILFFNTLTDVVLENTAIPKGTGIFVQTQYGAINESNFSYPDKFIPERWLAGGCPLHAAHNERAYTPFGAGPRFCPGYNLAILEIKMVLAMVCKNFLVTMESDADSVKEELAFTMMPTKFLVRLKKRIEKAEV